MKTLGQFISEAKNTAKKGMCSECEDSPCTCMNEENEINEGSDIELKPHENGTHYTVHKIHPNSGIQSDQLKTGEKINDTHVDDLKDMGYRVKIHSK